VQEICEAAGVTKPTLYHYFGNKRGLLEALVQERYAALIADLSQAAEYHRNLPQNLERVAMVYFRFAKREPTLYRLLLALWFTIPAAEAFQVIATLNARQQQIVETMFERAVADHGNMRGRQRTYAATFLGMINTLIGLTLNGYLELNDSLARRAIHQFSHSIYS
jgi:AcrR family transcriptional regulator